MLLFDLHLSNMQNKRIPTAAPKGQRCMSISTPSSRRPGAIAFIHFLTAAEAEVAIQTMNNHVLEDGRYLTVRCNTSPMAKS